jgi:regulator of sigma E protease
VNLILAFLILWGLFMINGRAEGTSTVRSIEPGSPAAQVLRDGDRIVAVDGKRGEREVLSAQISSHRCAGTPVDGCTATTPATLTIERDGRVLDLRVTPRYDAENRKTRVGFAYGGELVRQGPVKAAGTSVDTMWQVTEATVGVIVRLFYDAKARDEVGGVVGSYEATRQSFEFDTAQAIFILGLISLSLAVVNLFPFLPLDGGHIFWALAEKVRGHAIPFRVMERASLIGFALVGILFFIGLQNDIQRISSGELRESVR